MSKSGKAMSIFNVASHYFYLQRHCFVEVGRDGAAIYDLYQKDIYEIDVELGRIIARCENEHVKLADLVGHFDVHKKKLIFKRLNELSELGLGAFHDKRKIIGKLRPLREKPKYVTIPEEPLLLEKLWLEITSQCNLDCQHCDADIEKITRCGCSRLSTSIKGVADLSVSTWRTVIDDAELFNCQEIILTGGEPLLSAEFLQLIEYIRTKKIPHVCLKSNGLTMNKEILKQLKVNDVTWETTLFHFDEKIHDSITGYPGSLKVLVKNIRIAVKEGMTVRVIIEVMGRNYSSVSETIKYVKGLGVSGFVVEPVLSCQAEIWPIHLSKNIYKTKDNIQGVSQHRFFRNKEGHPCWNGSLAVTAIGDILPCPMARRNKIGNVRASRLRNIMRGKDVCKLWGLTKDEIDKCCDCEFRFACFDCRVRESQNGSISSQSQFCLIR